MQNKINNLKTKILQDLRNVKDEGALKELKVRHLGRKGELALMLKKIKDLGEAERKEAGKLANRVKQELAAAFKQAEEGFLAGKAGFVDVTLPGKRPPRGHLHPITQVENELVDLFTGLGFMILDGPELESDYFNFESLNIPEWHPARDMQDTFYVEGGKGLKEAEEGEKAGPGGLVMRTHTSPMQVRAMLEYGAPLRCVVPGKVYRAEATDAVHEHTFHQMEGLMVDKDISMANLIAVMRELIKGMFGREMETRVRPGYFPFVEPGIELDIKCTICNGAGCPSCKHSGWLELLPAGQVHPNVLKYGGIDPDVYSGFAFGLGTTRLAMMRHNINDIRYFMGGDMRFLGQF